MLELELIKHIPRSLALSSSCSVDSGAHDTFGCNTVMLPEVVFAWTTLTFV